MTSTSTTCTLGPVSAGGKARAGHRFNAPAPLQTTRVATGPARAPSLAPAHPTPPRAARSPPRAPSSSATSSATRACWRRGGGGGRRPVVSLPSSDGTPVPSPPLRPCRCTNDADITAYLNTPAVQTALHVKATTWQECGGVDCACPGLLVEGGTLARRPSPLPRVRAPADNSDIVDERTVIYPALQAAGLEVLIYNGESDACVPITDNRKLGCSRPPAQSQTSTPMRCPLSLQSGGLRP